MLMALQRGGAQPTEVDYGNAHGTSAPAGERVETIAVKGLFGEHAHGLAFASTKSMTGHLLGLRPGSLPPTINLDKPDPECELDHGANKARETRIGTAISNSFGFGGTNATRVLGRAE